MSKKCRAYSESKLGLEPTDNRKAFYAGWDAALAQQDAPVEPVAWMFTDREGTEFFKQREDWDGWWTPLYTAPPQRKPQTLDEAMSVPRSMAQAYENGYKAGVAAERERIIQFLWEMQRVVGDAHNHYGVAAVRIKEQP